MKDYVFPRVNIKKSNRHLRGRVNNAILETDSLIKSAFKVLTIAQNIATEVSSSQENSHKPIMGPKSVHCDIDEEYEELLAQSEHEIDAIVELNMQASKLRQMITKTKTKTIEL